MSATSLAKKLERFWKRETLPGTEHPYEFSVWCKTWTESMLGHESVIPFVWHRLIQALSRGY